LATYTATYTAATNDKGGPSARPSYFCLRVDAVREACGMLLLAMRDDDVGPPRPTLMDFERCANFERIPMRWQDRMRMRDDRRDSPCTSPLTASYGE
jgi:hypothetical protein